MTLAHMMSILLRPRPTKVEWRYSFQLEGVGLYTDKPDPTFQADKQVLFIKKTGGSTDPSALARKLMAFVMADHLSLHSETYVLRLNSGKMSPVDLEFMFNCDVWDYSGDSPVRLKEADDSVFLP